MNTATWRNTLSKITARTFNTLVDMEADGALRGNDIGMRSDSTGAMFRIRDNGIIDMFAKPNLGIRIDSETDAICIFAPRLYMYSDETNVLTTTLNGFMWNTMPLNIGATVPEVPALLPPGSGPQRPLQYLDMILRDMSAIIGGA